MCGIWAYIQLSGGTIKIPYNSAIKARGPDNTKEILGQNYAMVFHRLAIHDLEGGDQPFTVELGESKFIYMCNGEIYNYKKLIADHSLRTTTNSDCEVIGLLYHKYGCFEKVVNLLEGEFAIVGMLLKGERIMNIFSARDPYGVRPLYWSMVNDGIVFSSLISGIETQAYHFPPGYIGDMYNFKRYYSPRQIVDTSYETLVKTVIRCIEKRLDSERPIGFFLSGGLDSSLVVAIATKILGYKARTFSIGMSGGTDLEYAKKVSTHCGTEHTEVLFTPTEGLAEIPAVIGATETYDITTVRASVGQYLLAKHIRNNTDIRVILNGDGADEAQMGYLYNYFAPNPEMAHRDSLRLLNEIHCFDGLRVDRCLGAHGLEARVPFLDPEFVEACLKIPPLLRVPSKNRMEKYFIRKAFQTCYPGLLPEEVLWRKKEAFSDGVSKVSESWSEIIKDATKNEPIVKYRINPPPTPEAAFYSRIFNSLFPNQRHILPHYWMPEWTDASDPSARTLSLKV